MSQKYPIVAVTGSSGAGTTTVRHAFQDIFRREGIAGVFVEGDAFHRFDRAEMRARLEEEKRTLETLRDQVLTEGTSKVIKSKNPAYKTARMQATEAEARANLERLRQVRELSGGKVPSQAEMASAEAALTRAVAEEAGARASVTEAGASLRSDETNVRKASIRSPINGVVLEKLVDPNELVTPQSFGGTRGPSTALISVADPKDLQVEIDLNEADVSKVFLGQRCKVSPEAYLDRSYDGTVAEIAPEASRQKGTLQIKVQIVEPDKYLTPELSAKVDFLGGAGLGALVLIRRLTETVVVNANPRLLGETMALTDINTATGVYYSPAPNVEHSITTSKVNQTITFPTQGPKGYGTHPLASLGRAYEEAFNLGPVERTGDGHTPNNTRHDDSFQQVHGASYRQLFDLADWDRGLAINTPGQSGQLGSPPAPNATSARVLVISRG